MCTCARSLSLSCARSLSLSLSLSHTHTHTHSLACSVEGRRLLSRLAAAVTARFASTIAAAEALENYPLAPASPALTANFTSVVATADLRPVSMGGCIAPLPRAPSFTLDPATVPAPAAAAIPAAAQALSAAAGTVIAADARPTAAAVSWFRPVSCKGEEAAAGAVAFGFNGSGLGWGAGTGAGVSCTSNYSPPLSPGCGACSPWAGPLLGCGDSGACDDDVSVHNDDEVRKLWQRGVMGELIAFTICVYEKERQNRAPHLTMYQCARAR